MKVLALADIHLRGGHDTEEAQALMKAAEIAIERQVDVVTVNGDVFEAKSTPAQRLVFKAFLDRLKMHHIQIVVLRGNHDEAGDLQVFEDLADNVCVSEQPEMFRFISRQSLQVCEFHTIPHFNAAAVALQEDSVADLNESGTNLFDRILDGIFQKVRAYEGPSMVLFHAVVSGAHLDNNHIPKENGIHLNLQRLAVIGCPVVGGHYHAKQNVAAHMGGSVWYSGSLTRQTFGESEGDKGVLLYDSEKNWLEPEFISLNPSSMVLIETEWADGKFAFCFDPDYEVREGYANCRVRFRYTVPQHEIAAAKAAEKDVEEYFREARELKIDPQPVLFVAVRNEAIIAAETVEDCFKVWADAKGESAERIAAALELLKVLQSDSTGSGDDPVGRNTPDHHPGPVTPISESGSGQRPAGTQSSPVLSLFSQEEIAANAF